MRFLVKAQLKKDMGPGLLKAIQDGSLGQGSIAGDEYIHDMQQARLDNNGTTTWVEVCYCPIPLQEERPYWEKYFELISVQDAHARKNCRHENGSEAWACSNCDCTKKLEKKLSEEGTSFFQNLQNFNLSNPHSPT
jgi:hypothetical protein